jgi:hypothetical protein
MVVMNILQRRSIDPFFMSITHPGDHTSSHSLTKREYNSIYRPKIDGYFNTQYTPSSACLCWEGSYDESNFRQ